MRVWLFIVCCLFGSAAYAGEPRHVVLISFDGLRAGAVAKHLDRLPNFRRMVDEGATTLNARTDPDYTITLPNHTSMLTGRPVLGGHGHHVTVNDEVQARAGGYRIRGPGIFDVLDKAGLPGVMIASKEKFRLFARSFPIDAARINNLDDWQTFRDALRVLNSERLPAFLFLHFAGPDTTGHIYRWRLNASSRYVQTLAVMDIYLGQILRSVAVRQAKGVPVLVIVTSDHGGAGYYHGMARNKLNYVIPFLVWGSGVTAGADLYDLNPGRIDPVERQIPMTDAKQPIRNGDAANLALRWLGLGCVPQSTIGCAVPLEILKMMP